jgi:hypothetical protein
MSAISQQDGAQLKNSYRHPYPSSPFLIQILSASWLPTQNHSRKSSSRVSLVHAQGNFFDAAADSNAQTL